jgi:Tfp pilus assembly protein PilN
MDVARSVSQIIQFMQAHQIEHTLEAIRLAGIPEVDVGIYRAALSAQDIQVPLEPFESSRLSADKADVQSYLHAVSGLVTNGKQQNFLIEYNSNKRKRGSDKETSKGLILVAAVFIVMLVATLASVVVKLVKQRQLDQLEAEINDPLVLEQIAEYDELLERDSFLARQYDAIADVDENIQTYPICDDKIIQIIDDCSGDFATVNFNSFDADAGLVQVTATAENVDDINKFIRELNARDIFNEVNYTGYSFDSQTQLWDIHVTCTLVEAAGR